MKIKITFTLDHESDTDIIDYLDSMSPIARNVHIRQAIRDHIAIERNKTTLKDIYDRLENLIQRIENVYASGVPKQALTLSSQHIYALALDGTIMGELDDLNEIMGNIDSIGER